MPFFQTHNLTMSKALIDGLLAALSARPAAALLTTPTVHLFTAGPSVITPTQVPADFTEATFTGYASQTLGTLLGPIQLPNTEGDGVHADVNFLAGAVAPPGQMILGYWIDDGATTFFGGEVFPNPIPIGVPGAFIDLDVVFPILSPAPVF